MALPSREVKTGELIVDSRIKRADIKLQDSSSAELRIGAIIAFLFFVVLIGWSAFARLDAAAYGEGKVSVSGNRLTIQHRDGGFVQELDIKEGQHVVAGQVLLRLSTAEIA